MGRGRVSDRGLYGLWAEVLMTRRMSAKRCVQLARRLDSWAAASSSPDAQRAVVHLADLYSAATRCQAAIDVLAHRPPRSRRDRARALVEIEAWLTGSLADSMKPLTRLIPKIAAREYSAF